MSMRVQELPVYFDCSEQTIRVEYFDNAYTGCAGTVIEGPAPLTIRLCEEFVSYSSSDYGILRSAQFSVLAGNYTGGYSKASVGTQEGYVAGDVLTFTTNGVLAGVITGLLPPGSGYLNLYVQYAVNGGIVDEDTPSVETWYYQPTSVSSTEIDVTLSSYIPKRDGYVFAGWKVSGELYTFINDGDIVQPGQNFSGTYAYGGSLCGLLLLAQWELPKDPIVLRIYENPGAAVMIYQSGASATNPIRFDWGDGTSGSYVGNGTVQHTYAEDVEFPVDITVQSQSINIIRLNTYIDEVVDFGNAPIVSFTTSTSNTYPSNLVKVPTYLPPTIQSISLPYCPMFNDPSVKSWDTSHLTTFANMFQNCISFNQELNWNTSNGTSFRYAFSQCTSLTEDINFDLSNATNTAYMFNGATLYNSPVTVMYNTKNVQDMQSMFYNATNFSQDLSQWCVPVVTSIGRYTFSQGSAMTAEQQPVWGTCPRGEDQE